MIMKHFKLAPPLLISCAFVSMTQTLMACGPQAMPRYSTPYYFDPDQSANRNFNQLALDYSRHSNNRRMTYYGDELKEIYLEKLNQMIEPSGRNMRVNMKVDDVREEYCPGNELSIYKFNHMIDVTKPIPPDYKKIADSVEFIIEYTGNTCGSIQPYGYENNIRFKPAYDELVAYNGSYKEYIWYVLARYFAYRHEQDTAYEYLEKINNTQLQELKTYAEELEFNLLKMSGNEMPVNIRSRLKYFYTYYYTSVCGSNNSNNVILFFKQLLASNASDRRVVDLFQAREILADSQCRMPNEFDAKTFASLLNSETDTTIERDFSTYLLAASLLYQAKYQESLDLFSLLESSDNDWIRQTVSYLKGRILLIMAQKDWNGYKSPAEVLNRNLSARARIAFDAYLNAYPNGEYRNSATGLLRRIDFLEGNLAQYSLAISERLHELATLPQSGENNDYMNAFMEWRRFSNRKVDYRKATPLLITFDILHSAEEPNVLMTRLRAQENKFEQNKVLFQLLSDYLIYKEGKYSDINTGLLPSDYNTQSEIGLAVVKAKASMKQGDYRRARAIYTSILTGNNQKYGMDTLQLELASTYAAQSDYRSMTDKHSQIELAKIFQDMLFNVCKTEELVTIANDTEAHPNARTMARAEAFSRYIFSGDFKALYSLFGKVKDPGEFSLIETASRSLATDENNAKGLLNLGFFMLQIMKPPPYESVELFKPTPEHEKQCPTIYLGKRYFGPKEYLSRVVELHNGNKKSIDEAKALHYLTTCNKPGWSSGRCNWGYHKHSVLSSKEAFVRLHKKYPNSKWTQKTPYYY